MAKFTIYNADGTPKQILYGGKTYNVEGAPVFNGTYTKVAYIEFSEISVPAKIAWEVGDYVLYRTGMRYELYDIPSPEKHARVGEYGGAIVYRNVIFKEATAQLEIALFLDTVERDNNIHYSSRPNISTYEDVYGIAARIQANMDVFYSNRWTVKVVDNPDEDLEAILREAKAFTIDSGSCLGALNTIYNTWDGIGWVHTYDNTTGKDVITIGAPNMRVEGNTTSPFLYGKGKGLSVIRRSITNKDTLCTRLYPFGSSKNMISRYYNGKPILNAESVDIDRLMLPIGEWGTTEGLPDPSKAYLENAAAVARYGLIPHRVDFDGSGKNEEIYPTIKGMTAKLLRDAMAELGETKYMPDAAIYPDDAEMDRVKVGSAVTDDGREVTPLYDETNLYEGVTNEASNTVENTYVGVIHDEIGDFETHIDGQAARKALIRLDGRVRIDAVPQSINRLSSPQSTLRVEFHLYDGTMIDQPLVQVASSEEEIGGVKHFYFDYLLPSTEVVGPCDLARFYLVLVGTASFGQDSVCDSITITAEAGTVKVTTNTKDESDASFKIEIPQVGFDISLRSALSGALGTLAMNDGRCGGRSFTIKNCKYQSATDTWLLTLDRVKDGSLEQYFPNNISQIKEGDRFVLTDIVMPESYIEVASQKLLDAATLLYSDISRGQPYYEPDIDSALIVRNGYSLREGMYFNIQDTDVVDDAEEYILIDSVEIRENESNIPQYKVTLREKKRLSYAEVQARNLASIEGRLDALADRDYRLWLNSRHNIRQAELESQRRWVDARQTTEMLNEALLHFSGAISPISVQTMQALIGDESLQFRFVTSKEAPLSVDSGFEVSYNADTHKVTIKGGLSGGASILQHLTLGIDNLSGGHTTAEYLFWDIPPFTSAELDAPLGYYVYAKVAKSGTGGEFVVSSEAIGMEEIEGHYHLLIGILNSEHEGARSFAQMFGYTEISPGRIIVDRITASNGINYFDLLNGALHIGNAEGTNYLDYNAESGVVSVAGNINVKSGSIGLGNFDEYEALDAEIKSRTPYNLVLSNMYAGVACDSEGVVTGTLPQSDVNVYYGATLQSGWDFSLLCTGCTAHITDGVLVIDTLTADDATVVVTATKSGRPTLTGTMTIAKVKSGLAAVQYYIVPSALVVRRNADGTASPSSVGCEKYKIVGNAPAEVTTDHSLYFRRSDTPNEWLSYLNPLSVRAETQWIEFALLNGFDVLDSQRVQVLEDAYAAEQVRSDLEYLTDALADENISTTIGKGLVLTNVIGIKDSSTGKVVAGMTDGWLKLGGAEYNTKVPMIFAGSTDAEDINNADFRVMPDGEVYGNKMTLYDGCRVGGFLIEDSWLSAERENYFVDMSAAMMEYQSTDFPILVGYFSGDSLYPYNTSQSSNFRVLTYEGAYAQGVRRQLARFTTSINNPYNRVLKYVNSAIYVSAEGASPYTFDDVEDQYGNFALLCPHGKFAGLRPNVRVVQNNYSTTLKPTDHSIITVGKAEINFPSDPEDGQQYFIFISAAYDITFNFGTKICRRCTSSPPLEASTINHNADFRGLDVFVYSKETDKWYMMVLAN